MYLFKKRYKAPTFEMYYRDGRRARLNLKFQNGEMHLNPDRMDRGIYELAIDRGETKEYRQIKVV